MDNTKRFDNKGEIYAKARPKYSQKLLEHLKSRSDIPENAVIADIGSGTGIFTEQLLNAGYKAFAVEPNNDMRKIAEQNLSGNPNFTSVNGRADSTSLPDNSIDIVTAAQAFHWFDKDLFRAECNRILKKNGLIILVYNSRIESAECTIALKELRKKYNPEFNGFSNGISEDKCKEFFNGKCEILTYDNSVTYDRKGYINRVLSSSYSLKKGDEKFNDYLNDIDALFDKYSQNGTLTVPTDTVAYIGK